MPESTPPDRLTETPVNRAPEGEGFRAPFATEKGEPIQQSIYDGAGNEIVVVTTEDAEGNRKQGTGADAAEAMADAQKSDEVVGEGFYPPPGH